ncbi:MAG: 2-dehydro-3-deoxygalactonokinase [Verrucomicrobiales bacterium]|nr:2-dehydro-3-deoxygalactonokinase [Verrucomicrobiales bacterium]
MNTDEIEWIAADWGTSNLRCWAMSSGNEVLFRAESDQGMAAITSIDGDFEAALLELIRPWLRSGSRIPVSACGMVGAKQGWIEAPYLSAPCPPLTSQISAPSRSGNIDVRIHAGVKQLTPADVMRGEETQIAGLLATNPDFNGLVCLPGTHTKWVTVRENHIQTFRTYLTGELFKLVSEQSVLRLTTATEGWNESAFLEGIHSAFDAPESLLSNCFSLRAEALLNDLGEVDSRSRLSGYLIGQELSGALHRANPDEEITLIGSDSLAETYCTALKSLGWKASIFPGETAILAGLAAGRG